MKERQLSYRDSNCRLHYSVKKIKHVILFPDIQRELLVTLIEEFSYTFLVSFLYIQNNVISYELFQNLAQIKLTK